MISQLTIHGFKGFKHIEFSKLTRLSLFGGRNNIGKTSIIEAIFMFYDRNNPQMILSQFARRGVNSITFNPESMWSPIFFDYDMENEISISIVNDENKENIFIKFNPQYVSASIPATNKRGIKFSQIRTDQKPQPSHSLDIVYDNKKTQKQTTHLVMGVEGIGIHIEGKIIKIHQVAFIGSRSAINPSEDAQKFGQLDILGKQEKIIEFLKIMEPNLKSLSSVAIGDHSLIHGDIGLSRKIPVLYMGEGVSRLLSIILAIATSKNGIVLIDEFENGIHYSVMPKIWEAVAKAAQEYQCQVIGTTHSYECLEAAYNGLSKHADLRNDFSYIRIDKINNTTIAKCFDYDLLKIAIKANMEIR